MEAKSWSFGLTTTLCAGVAFYAIWAYGSGVQRVPVHPEMQAGFNEHRALITTHALGASVALLLGPFQFLDRLRFRYPRLHRILGYLYLGCGVGIGGIAGIALARYSFGGLVSHLGFGLLGCLWLFTGIMAVVAIRQRKYAEHRRWMVRNFALTLAAVTLRLYLPASVILGLDFTVAYPAIAWICWAPNLFLAEWGQRKLAPAQAR